MARFALVTAASLAAFGTLPFAAAAEDSMCLAGDALFAFQSVDLLGVEPAAPTGDGDEREILWCASPDDPRCSPAQPAPQGSSSFLPFAFPAAGVAACPELGAPTWTLLARTSIEGQALAGVRQRVERPPRA